MRRAGTMQWKSGILKILDVCFTPESLSLYSFLIFSVLVRACKFLSTYNELPTPPTQILLRSRCEQFHVGTVFSKGVMCFVPRTLRELCKIYSCIERQMGGGDSTGFKTGLTVQKGQNQNKGKAQGRAK